MSRILSFAALVAAAPLAAQSLPPVRPIGATVARSTELMGSVSTVVGLPGGKLLVNDILRRRVLLFDSTLTDVKVIADSTSSTANAYGARAGGLLAYRGDSALFVDPASLSMLVITPGGEITRVMSAPRDVGSLIGGPAGVPGFDPAGRLVYRANPGIRVVSSGSGRPMPEFPGSAPVVRFDLAARMLDTVAFFGIAKPNIKFTETPTGGTSMTSSTNPLPIVDDWALLSDGTVAIVRGADYSIDWIAPNGSRSSSGKIPYEWQRLDDDGKAALLDSVRAELEKVRERAQARMDAGGGPVVMSTGGGGGGGAPDVVVMRGAVAGAAPPARGGGAAGRGDAGRSASFQLPPVNLVSADELPDYRPPFTSGATRGDQEGNLWVRTTSPVGNDGPIYFIINKQGQVIDRVQLPSGRLVVGFGKNGDVYMAVRDADENARVERARIR